MRHQSNTPYWFSYLDRSTLATLRTSVNTNFQRMRSDAFRFFSRGSVNCFFTEGYARIPASALIIISKHVHFFQKKDNSKLHRL